MSTLVSPMPPTMTEVPTRTCPHCGFEERSERERCSRCGKSVLVRAPRLRGRRRRQVLWGSVAVGVLAVAAIVLVLNAVVSHRNERASKTSVTGEGGQSVGRLGFPFVAALDFKRFTYVWCRNTPGQGERGIALAFVRLDRACLAAKGRALGTGYVDVPGS